MTPQTANVFSSAIVMFQRLKADSHYASRFSSVTAPSSFCQNRLCSHCTSCSVTFQNSTL